MHVLQQIRLQNLPRWKTTKSKSYVTHLWDGGNHDKKDIRVRSGI